MTLKIPRPSHMERDARVNGIVTAATITDAISKKLYESRCFMFICMLKSFQDRLNVVFPCVVIQGEFSSVFTQATT